MTRPVIFISYSQEDEEEKDELLSHLGVVQNTGIDLWSVDQIRAGADFEVEICKAIAQAKIAILLITAKYLTSEFILSKEIPALLERRKHEGLTVFPVIATACAWETVDWLNKIEVRPKNGRPVWSNGGKHVNEYLAAIAKEVALIIDSQRGEAGALPRTESVYILDKPQHQTVEQTSKASYDSGRSIVEIKVKGDPSTFTVEQKTTILKMLAINLNCPPGMLNALSARGGSIILEVEMPTEVADRLIALYKADDLELQDLGIEQVRIIRRQFIISERILESPGIIESSPHATIADASNGTHRKSQRANIRLSDKLMQVEDAAASLLSSLDSDSVERSIIEEKVRAIAEIQGDYSEQDISDITRRLEERFNISMSLGTLFSAEDFRPWLLDDARAEIDWYYWDRYRRLLGQQRFPQQVINGLDSITDQILDHLENPNKDGKWARKGMVVGHVQSGKTANYIGLINKAADSGYKVIIVLAGMLTSLRNQTQFRVDNGFIGRDTEQKAVIGVGLFSNEKIPAYFTTNTKDFKKAVANQIGVGIGGLKEPVVLVIKKNKGILENLIDWLKHNNPHNLKNYPMLLLDDEADHASINTRKMGDVATTINRKIRELLSLFDRSSYVGYTATPFANVFIDPETKNEMLDDLFPRDFIISLDPPSNYVGSARVFSSDRDLDIVRVVNDYEDDLHLKHKIDWQPEDIPASLKEAIKIFILSRAIRLLRGQVNTHNSMLINVSRFTAVQSNVKLLVDEYLKENRQAIINHYKLNTTEALKNSTVASLKNIFDKEFLQTGHTWDEVQVALKRAVSPIGVIEVNSSSAAEPLDYSRQNYPRGRNVIAIGGMSLSRGLTLEGLTVSYFLRNSVMYDTLMQMGRWFGYRDGYAELCRIYMTAEAESWYAYISDATDELRKEFKRMKAAGMSPKDFGLCIRSHPESLIVTARNKMRTGTRVLRQVSLEGRLVETSILLNNPEIIQQNFASMEAMVLDANQFGRKADTKARYFWQDVPAQYVLQFIERFQNHPASQLTEKQPLKDYIEWLEAKGIDKWDVVLVTLAKGGQSNIEIGVGDFQVTAQKRKVTEYPDKGGSGIALNKRRVASRGLEKMGLSDKETTKAEENYTGKNIPDHAYRSERRHPLLMLHLLDCRLADDLLFEQGITAYGISFPGKAGSRRPQKLVEYVVNTVWWKNEYWDLLDEEEEIEDE